MTDFIQQQKLFDDAEFVRNHQVSILQREWQTSSCKISKARSRKLSFQHIDIAYQMRKVGEYEFPKVEPYVGEIPSVLTPYDHHRTGMTHGAVHFFVDDDNYPCMHIWDKLQIYTRNVSRYNIIIAPDNSLYLDQSKSLNIYQLYQNRLKTAYWQKIGLNVIPTVSWGNADSFDYCFEALPSDSVLAIGGLGTKRSKSLTKLWECGVNLTIERLCPKTLILYGAPVKLELSIKTYYINDYIHVKFPKIS